jgi:sulfoxide reductase catalytic subunit YedY
MKEGFRPAVLAALALAAAAAASEPRIVLSPRTPRGEIAVMHPSRVDASGLPLDPVEELHTTATPPRVDAAEWRLSISGAVEDPATLSYEQLLRLPTESKRAILICPGVFVDYAEWEGVPFAALLAHARPRPGAREVTVRSIDGYEESFSLEEARSGLLLLALRVNGLPLPLDHGFPARLVVEDSYGGRWVKWVREVRVD